MMAPAISKEGLCEYLRVSEGTIDGWMRREWTRGREYVVKGLENLRVLCLSACVTRNQSLSR